MASTYSNIKIQLMATGENTTTWGDVTNVNLGTAIEEAIVGSADVAFSNANVTLTLTDTNSTQAARNMRLNLTGTATSGYNLIVPAIEKPYIINNSTDGTITVKNATGTGIAVPTGKTIWVYNNGTNVVDATTHLTSLTLGTPLAVAQGGTGANTLTSGYLLKGNGTSAVSAAIVYDSGSLVGVGAGTAAKTRLQVTAAGFLNAPVLGNATGAPFYVTNADPAYGFVMGINAADGRAWLQAQRTDGAATAANITLNEAGGNVGVGIAPAVKFDVNGRGRFLQDTTATTGAIILRQNSGNTLGGYIQWVTNDNSGEKGWMVVDSSSNMLFAPNSVESVRFTSTGRVGIGTPTPSTALQVNGTVTATTFAGAGTSLTGTASGLTVGTATNATNAANLVAANFSIVESGGVLYFKYGGTNIAKLESNGAFTALNNVTGFGTV